MSKRVLFIDRDGTIVVEPSDEQLDSFEKLEFVPGVFRSLSFLRSHTDFEFVMASNQDGLGTPSYPEKDFYPTHNFILNTLKGEGVEFDDLLIDTHFPQDNAPTRQSLEMYIHEGLEAIKRLYPLYPFAVAYLRELAEKAISWADNNRSDVENIEAIGGGWTGEEALAIALYCVCRHFDNFENALIAAVNHAGDSDSTGAITGNILGAAIGYEAIPKFFLDDLELHDVILHMADDLYKGEITN